MLVVVHLYFSRFYSFFEKKDGMTGRVVGDFVKVEGREGMISVQVIYGNYSPKFTLCVEVAMSAYITMIKRDRSLIGIMFF